MPGAEEPEQEGGAPLLPAGAVGGDLAGMPPGYPDPSMVAMITQQLMAGNFAGTPSGYPGVLPGMLGGPLPPASPEWQVRVTVQGCDFAYELTDEDLRKVFSRYGKVLATSVTHTTRGDKGEPGASQSGALVTFEKMDDAIKAIADLNNKSLNSVPGKLCVEWHVDALTQQIMAQHYLQSSMMAALMEQHQGAPSPANRRQTFGTDLGSPTHDDGRSVRKYTCRFDIGIENDKEFQVARRIIGTKGANMKRIVKQSDAKLRLRGRGSGFLEGAQRQESSEPLHLCISCKDQQGYHQAVEEVEKLLRDVYAAYQDFCRQRGRPVTEIRVQKREHPLLLTSGGGSTRRNRANSGMSDMSPTGPGTFWGPGSPTGGGWQSQAGTPWHGRSSVGAATPGAATPSMDPFAMMSGLAFQGLGQDAFNQDNPELWGLGKGDKGSAEIQKDAPPPEEIESLINERNEARRGNNFEHADKIRMDLRARGIALMDEPGGRGKGSEVTTWRYWRQ